MSLSKEERERLSSIVQQRRQDHSSTPRRHSRDPTTDESIVLVCIAPRNDSAYHAYADGQPACGTHATTSFREMDIETAREWHRPCKTCYPDGDEQ